MKELLEKNEIGSYLKWALEHTYEFSEAEYGQTNESYKRSARYVYKLLKEEGAEAELLSFPADGKTVYRDTLMPYAWEASVGRLAVLSSSVPFEEKVLADLKTEPFSLIRHSAATPEGGTVTNVISEAMVYAGEDARGSLVLLEKGNRPVGENISPLLDLGALGFITEFSPKDAFDAKSRYAQADSRDFLGFYVKSEKCDSLRRAVLSGGVKVKAESDGKKYCGEADAVTALIKGESEKELWVTAHLYKKAAPEKIPSVILAASAMKLISDMIKNGNIKLPHFSIRFVFAMEHYGFAALTQHLENIGGEKKLAEINVESCLLCGEENSHNALNPENYENCILKILDFLEKTDEDIADDKALLKKTECRGEQISLKWLDYAEKIVAKRKDRFLPADLVKIPEQKRKGISDGENAKAIFEILSYMDGKTNLKEIILRTAFHNNLTLDESLVKKYVNAVMILADGGYLELVKSEMLTKEDIKNALSALGIKKGDCLLVHGAQIGCGHTENGADTVIDAFYEAVGKNGGVLMPSFTRPYAAFEGSLNKGRNFRPFEKENTENIWTGELPKAMARRKGAVRSAHSTHSWCGLGEKAEICTSKQALLDPPASDTSPMAEALILNGKVCFYGCGVGSNTFIHYIEYKAKSAFLENAIVKIKDADGKIHTEVIHNHVPGCRDFYKPKNLDSKFYVRAIKKGLTVKEEKLGMGKIYVMDLKELYDIGMELFKEDKNVTLCDDENCRFCKKYR